MSSSTLSLTFQIVFEERRSSLFSVVINTIIKSSWGMEGFTWLVFPCHSLLLREAVAGTQTVTEAEIIEYCLMTCSRCSGHQLWCTTQRPGLMLGLSTTIQVLLYQLPTTECPTDMPVCQYDEGNSQRIPQITLAGWS